jgi:hypothetical protein
MGSRAAIRWLAIAVSASVLVACGSGSGGTRHRAGAEKATVSRPRFDAPGTAVLLWCNSTDTTTRVMLSSVSLRDGRTVASTTFELPDGTKPSLDCEQYDSGRESPVAMRSLFDRGFRRMAVTVTDTTTDAVRASTVDVASGVPAALPPIAGGFGSTPDQESPVFQPGTDQLWFVDSGADQVMSLDPASGRTTSHGKPTGNGGAIVPGPKGYFVVDDGQVSSTVVAPDGGHAMVERRLVPLGKTPIESPGIGGGIDSVPGKEAACAFPQEWLDDQNLLCDSSSGLEPKFDLVTFSPGRKSITADRTDLLPKTNRESFAAVPSPDRKSFAFLSRQGQQVTLFTQSLAPGSTPVQVTDVRPPRPPVDTLSFGQTLVPNLPTWQ